MQHDKRVRTPSPSVNNITEDYHQDKRPRTLDDSHSNEEVNAATTLTELFDSPAPINRLTRTMSQLSVDIDNDEGSRE